MVASELQPLASRPLPEIPSEAAGAKPQADAPAPEPAGAQPEPEPEPAAAGPSASRSRPGAGRTSRVGGAVLLGGGAAIVIAVVLVLVLTGGGSKKHSSTAAAASTTATQPTSTRSATTPQVIAQINLKPPAGGKSPAGVAEVLREQGKTGIAIVAQGLTPNTKKPANAYAVWLYNSPTDSRILGFVNPGVGTNGRLQTAGGLPTNASHFQKLLVTMETQSNPKSPGTIVLEGQLTGV